MFRYTKIAIVATVLVSTAAMAYAAKTMENDATNIAQAKIPMTQAITVAEQHANGKAARAEYEQTKGGWAYDVEVISGAKVFDVRVDADKGTVISSVEDRADHDDEHDQKDYSLRRRIMSTERGDPASASPRPYKREIVNTALSESTTRMLNKVPEVTLFFWIIKIMATTVGETGADFLNSKLHFGLIGTTVIMGVLLLISLFIQMRFKKYVPWIYWIAVVLLSVFGTLITDNLVDNFGIALETTTILFSVALAITFAAWYASEKTLSIHTIYTSKRELFYWAAILFTFALGTAAGDLGAEGLHLGYAISALAFGALIGIVAIAHYFFKLNAVVAFWIAYVLTRPFGASCGDFLSQPVANGGVDLGTVGTSIIFLVSILGLVTYLTISQKKFSAQERL